MVISLNKLNEYSVHQDIQLNPSWLGNISGLKAEKMLENRKTPFLYVLRKGENQRSDEVDYYVTFIQADLSIKHQPFVIRESSEGWHYYNGGVGGPYQINSIEEVLHLIMHCQKGECKPLDVRG